MAVVASKDPGKGPGLFTSLSSFWGVLISIFQTRLDLITLELEEEGRRALQLIFVGLSALLALAMAFFFAMFFLIAALWETPYRVPVIGGICALCSVICLVLILVARHMIATRPRFLSHTLDELNKDAEHLKSIVETVVVEPKP